MIDGSCQPILNSAHCSAVNIGDRKRFLLGFVAPGVLAVGCGEPGAVALDTARIAGGEKVTTNRYPFSVAIFRGGTDLDDFLCGGVLVKEDWILTAAHCVDEIRFAQRGQLRIGVGRRFLGHYTDENTFRATAILRHANYDPVSFNFDVALIRLDQPADQPRPVLMTTGREADLAKPGDMLWTIGHGRRNSHTAPGKSLFEASVPVVGRNACRAAYEDSWITHRMLCAGGEPGEGACLGDDGSPLLAQDDDQWVLAGVNSWGRGCGEDGRPSVYTRVPGLRPWINECTADPSICAKQPATSCERRVVLTGYWPPTNEMLRQWSDDPAKNGGAWVGKNWRGRGYDVYAHFPEFPAGPPHGPWGSDTHVGQGELTVDYQDTSSDFWDIVDEHDPVLLITTSRGGDSIGWELEALEGGHASVSTDPARDWYTDGRGPVFPDEDTIDARSWDAITRYRDQTVASSLPLTTIANAVTPMALTNVEIDHGTSGNYLSGFMALHGLYYNATHRNNLAAGHIHVGVDVSAQDAEAMMETTLEAVLSRYPVALSPCSDPL